MQQLEPSLLNKRNADSVKIDMQKKGSSKNLNLVGMNSRTLHP